MQVDTSAKGRVNRSAITGALSRFLASIFPNNPLILSGIDGSELKRMKQGNDPFRPR
jgi:hypothetical protein